MRRVLLKLGTGVLTDHEGQLASTRLARILDEIIPQLENDQQLIIVTSGAVGLGRVRLGLTGQLSLNEKQMCASVGQAVLMQYYNMILSKYNLTGGQILLTSGDLAQSNRRENLRTTLSTMGNHPVVPIINENDAISSEELEALTDHSFSDNDQLSSLLAVELAAELLVILTDIEGIYLDRASYDRKEYLHHIDDLKVLDRIQIWSSSQMGRGGALSKVAAARLTANAGIACWITSGMTEHQLAAGLQNLRQGRLPRAGSFISGKGQQWKN